MAVKRVVPIFRVADIRSAVEFYCSTLGFATDFSYSTSPDGPTYAGVSLDGHQVHLSTFGGDGITGTVAYLYVDDVDAIFATFLRAGLKTPGKPNSPVEDAPVDQSWGMREFYVRDPDGNTLRFGSPISRASYRKGAIGALMDEYERAASELRRVVEALPEEEFTRIVDSQTSDEDCRSAQTIVSHVVSAGYGYAFGIRKAFSTAGDRPLKRLLSYHEALPALEAMLEDMRHTLDGRWEMTNEAIAGTVISAPWGVTYDLEQLLEHAVVHVLRHRRQIEKFVHHGLITKRPGV